jgi:hypothetical protein
MRDNTKPQVKNTARDPHNTNRHRHRHRHTHSVHQVTCRDRERCSVAPRQEKWPYRMGAQGVHDEHDCDVDDTTKKDKPPHYPCEPNSTNTARAKNALEVVQLQTTSEWSCVCSLSRRGGGIAVAAVSACSLNVSRLCNEKGLLDTTCPDWVMDKRTDMPHAPHYNATTWRRIFFLKQSQDY